METRNIFENISPLDHRYSLSDRELFKKLSTYLSEDAQIRYCVQAEAALLKSHFSLRNITGKEILESVDALERTIDSGEVYQEEEKTRHNVRALVNVIKRHVHPEAAPFVHLGATSVDILDTAFAMRIRDSVRKVLLPVTGELEHALIGLAEKEAETPQVGRTHGQHAVPITFGFAVAEYVSRLGKSIDLIEKLSRDLRGKLSGAVGAYNASTLLTPDPFELERVYLSHLGLAPSDYSTQMVEPEYLLRLLLEINTAFGIIANLADDLRHLQRSEIDELREFFGGDQVGSSTMPQKRNPWNSEHVKSLWKTFSPRVITFYMDQISEHQRDLSNSASSRFVAEYITGFCNAASRMKKIIDSLHVNREKMAGTLGVTGEMILAEAAYVLLSLSGDPDAHERVRKITLICEKEGKGFADELRKDAHLWDALDTALRESIGKSGDDFFAGPELYRGKAVEKCLEVCAVNRKLLGDVQQRLE